MPFLQISYFEVGLPMDSHILKPLWHKYPLFTVQTLSPTLSGILIKINE